MLQAGKINQNKQKLNNYNNNLPKKVYYELAD